MWGNICGVGPSHDTIEGHVFSWPHSIPFMYCARCGWRWNGMSRWFRAKNKVFDCVFKDAEFVYNSSPWFYFWPTVIVQRTIKNPHYWYQ